MGLKYGPDIFISNVVIRIDDLISKTNNRFCTCYFFRQINRLEPYQEINIAFICKIFSQSRAEKVDFSYMVVIAEFSKTFDMSFNGFHGSKLGKIVRLILS